MAALPVTLGFALDGGVLRWAGELPDVRAEDLLGKGRQGEPSEREEAAEWLREVLKDGPLPVSEVEKRAERELECSWKTIKRVEAKFQRVSDVMLLQALPQNVAGKTLKNKLQEMYLDR